jgi:sugar/nucleoside kinase (ribokinase family)
VAAFSYVGQDDWGALIRHRYQQAGIDTSGLLVHATGSTSTTAVLIDPSGERSFAHCVGAPRELNGQVFLDHLSLFARSRMVLIGYYSLMPNLEADLADVLARIRATGCCTALDSAGDGGDMQPLDRLLPHLDVYVPSLAEAANQTGETDPEQVLRVYRGCGATGLLGVKLGAQGALLSPRPDKLLEVPSIAPPGDVVDTTGAGDCFYAGLLTGLLRDMSYEQAGRLAAATGACCVTGLGASTGLRDYPSTAALAGL